MVPISFIAPLADRPIERLTRCVFGLGVFGVHIAKNVGMSAYEFVMGATCDVGKGEATLLFCNRRVELDLIEQVTQLFNERVVG